MYNLIQIILTVLFGILTIPFVNRIERELIIADTRRWAGFKEAKSSKWFFIKLFASAPEFRSVVYYRLRNRFRILPSLFLRGQTSCCISCPQIDEGLIMIHGYSTIINCKSVGKDCTFFQNVTIGYSKGHTPTIGSNCVFCCNSVVVGNVHVGNNVIIGAGAVVTHDVPDNSIVVGNPGMIRSRKFDGKILDYV